MLTRLAVSGYRSLRDIRLELGPLNVVTGANGSGKSSLYRALKLLADIAQGRVIQSLAAEGGLQSTLWAGPEAFSRKMKSGEQAVEGTRRSKTVALKLGFSGEDYGYAMDLGLPPPQSAPPPPAMPSLFTLDPQIKAESVWTGEELGRANAFAERRGPYVRVRGESGAWRETLRNLTASDSMMTHGADPHDALELLVLRERMKEWRFYDHLRTDREAPARRRQIGTYTPVLSSDGADLAAAIQTIIEIGDPTELDATINEAFPGANLNVVETNGYFELELQQHGLLRPLRVAELSDGTLRYLLLAAALLSPRPPELMILNEPETSLHPDLLIPLAHLIGKAAKNSQIILVSHASALVSALEDIEGSRQIFLEKQLSETIVRNGKSPNWTWPSR